jgi:hypothetical protein
MAAYSVYTYVRYAATFLTVQKTLAVHIPSTRSQTVAKSRLTNIQEKYTKCFRRLL